MALPVAPFSVTAIEFLARPLKITENPIDFRKVRKPHLREIVVLGHLNQGFPVVLPRIRYILRIFHLLQLWQAGSMEGIRTYGPSKSESGMRNALQ